MTTITKATLLNSIWRNLYDRIKDQVTSVTLSISPGSQTIQTYASSYSDVDFSSKNNFPIIVIDSPRVPQEQFTLEKTQVNGIIEITIFATNSQASDKFFDAINNSIETYKYEFAQLGLVNLDLESTDNDFVEHGSIKVHIRRARWKFNYRFSRTTGF